ncbi:hypothetical protein ACQ4M3_31985 [Leptolyngbya sp. AN03gr2]|uniref:hypothetical protein n=1 Tax=unclassified Leptolyngbya TaxID=2650499 RepID=UPI003D320B0E
MSEYQYYEFQAIDRPLTAAERSQIQKLSSRVNLTSTRASFVYNYSDFPGDPKKVLTQYFDVMFYVANWGSWQLIWRFPKSLIDPVVFQPYCIPHVISVSTTSKWVILDIDINDEAGDWVDGEGWLSQLMPLRSTLLQGDMRLLYLAWLRATNSVEIDLEDDPIEPPVPSNLHKLSAPLQAFIELVGLDPDLVTAAAQASSTQKSAAEPPLETWISSLSAAEQREFLIKFARQEPHTDLQFIQRLKELAKSSSSGQTAPVGQRRLSELTKIAVKLRSQREQKERDAAHKKRLKELEILAPKEAEMWKKVWELVALKRVKPYDDAIKLLIDLRDLADYQGRSTEFTQQVQQLWAEYANLTGFTSRLKQARLSK